jgi:hypothetical protein
MDSGAVIRKFSSSKKSYLVPSYVEITLDGKTIFKDPKPEPWTKNESTHDFRHKDFIFFITNFNDGIDIDYSRLFIIKNNKVFEQKEIMTQNWDNKFITTKKGVLYYWSDWFCQASNEKVKTHGPYVYRFSEEAQKFEEFKIKDFTLDRCKLENVELRLNLN